MTRDPSIDRGRMGIWLRRIHWAGAIYALFLLLANLLSFSLSYRLPWGEVFPRERAFLDGLPVLHALAGWLGESPGRFEVALGVLVPRAVMTGIWLYLGWRILRPAGPLRTTLEASPPAILAAIRNWALLFAVLSLISMPVLVQDFWLSVGWGRMLAAGSNPYLLPLDPQAMPHALSGLPLDRIGSSMTYGPLWALVCGLLSRLTDGVLSNAVALRICLMGAWIGAIFLIDRMLRGRPAGEHALGLLMFGWLPVGVVDTLAEGHNDVVLVFFLLAWMAGLEARPRSWVARLALAASFGVKYVTAPLVALDWWWGRRYGLSNGGWGVRWGVLGLGLSVMGAVVVGSRPVLDPLLDMLDWHFLTPSDAVMFWERLILRLTGVEVWPVASWMVRALMPGVALVAFLRLRRSSAPGGAVSQDAEPRDRLRWTVGWGMAAVSMGLIGHLWPWFFLWVIGPAATSPRSALGRFATGLGLGLPFAMAWIQIMGDMGGLVRMFTPSLGLYLWLAVWWKWSASWRFEDRFRGQPTDRDPEELLSGETVERTAL